MLHSLSLLRSLSTSPTPYFIAPLCSKGSPSNCRYGNGWVLVVEILIRSPFMSRDVILLSRNLLYYYVKKEKKDLCTFCIFVFRPSRFWWAIVLKISKCLVNVIIYIILCIWHQQMYKLKENRQGMCVCRRIYPV